MKFLSYILIALTVVSCAQIKTPTGGTKDITSPKILESYPQNLETNYRAKSISMEFDELVSLKNPKNNIIITPPLATTPDIYLKSGNILIISFKEKLDSNTTYTLNLGDAIVDYNESNALEENTLVFSTGDIIDSLSYSGSVTHSQTNLACESCKVMLYKEPQDSIVYKEKPYYFVKTNKNGKFTFKHLKEGDYKLLALDDKDNDFLYDEIDEEIGFIEKHIAIGKDSIDTELFVFKQDPSKLILLSNKMIGNKKLLLNFNIQVEDLKITNRDSLAEDYNYTINWNTSKDSAEVFFNPIISKDNIKLSIFEKDSLIDDLSAYINTNESPMTLASPKRNSKKYNSRDSLILKWSNPISKINKEHVFLKKDSLDISFSIDQTDPNTTEISYIKEENSKYILTIDSAAIIDIYNQSNDSLSHIISIQEDSYYGRINISTDSLHGNHVVFLNTLKGINIQKTTIDSEGKATFTNLVPGKYSITILDDKNSNGKWDTGNYLEGKQSERIVLRKDNIDVRSNWDIEIEF